jgi:hypothetical protein
MAKKTSIIYSLLFVFVITNSGCFTTYQALNTNGKSPVYLHIVKPENYSFYVNGEKTEPEFLLYSTKEVSSNYTTTTYETTSLPALSVKANKPYIALKIVNNITGQQNQYILKSGLKTGAKWILYLQGFCTMGLANVVDIGTSSVYAWPEMEVK